MPRLLQDLAAIARLQDVSFVLRPVCSEQTTMAAKHEQPPHVPEHESTSSTVAAEAEETAFQHITERVAPRDSMTATPVH